MFRNLSARRRRRGGQHPRGGFVCLGRAHLLAHPALQFVVRCDHSKLSQLLQRLDERFELQRQELLRDDPRIVLDAIEVVVDKALDRAHVDGPRDVLACGLQRQHEEIRHRRAQGVTSVLALAEHHEHRQAGHRNHRVVVGDRLLRVAQCPRYALQLEQPAMRDHEARFLVSYEPFHPLQRGFAVLRLCLLAHDDRGHAHAVALAGDRIDLVQVALDVPVLIHGPQQGQAGVVLPFLVEGEQVHFVDRDLHHHVFAAPVAHLLQRRQVLARPVRDPAVGRERQPRRELLEPHAVAHDLPHLLVHREAEVQHQQRVFQHARKIQVLEQALPHELRGFLLHL